MKDKKKSNINVSINKDLYFDFKIHCMRNKIKIYEGIEKALNFYIENKDKILESE